MRIRTKILLAGGLAGIGVGLTMAGFIVTLNAFNRFSGRSVLHGEISRNLFQLQQLTHEYLVDGSSRSYAQWVATEDVLSGLIASSILEPSAPKSAEELAFDHERFINAFANYHQAYVSGTMTPDKRTIYEDDFVLHSSGMMGDLVQMSAYDRTQFINFQNSVTILVLAVSLASIVLLFLVLPALYRSIFFPLFDLQRQVLRLRPGQFSLPFTKLRSDEIGDLRLAFQKMAGLLKETYGHLEDQVKIRTQELEMFRRAVEDASDSIIITKQNLDIVYVNKAWLNLHGYKLAEVVGQKPAMVSTRQTPPEVARDMRNAFTKGKPFFSDDIINARKDGSTYQADLRFFPILENKKPQFFVAILRDVSERKAVERMRDEFVSLATHQLKTPVTAMKWYSEMLLENKLKDIPQAISFVSEIQHVAERMNQLVNALLNVTRMESGRMSVKPVPTSLPTLVKEVLEELAPSIAEKHILVRTSVGKKLPVINVDANLIREVYRALCSNAIKYTPAGGELIIDIYVEGKSITSSISDTGIGIPLADQPNIFKKFFRAGNAVSANEDGTGLGLYLSRLIVSASDGSIAFNSTEGRGTTFTFTLPLKGSKPHVGPISISKVE